MGLPFRPWRPRGRPGPGLNPSPVESRSMSIMEYYETPDLRIESVVGLRREKEALRKALSRGFSTLLLVGPPGTGKSVLALAAAAEGGGPIIDVDFSRVGPMEERLIEEMPSYIGGKNYTVVAYNLDMYLVPRRGLGERIIIYDPYTDYDVTRSPQQGRERIIIYDPYTDYDTLKAKEERLAKMLEALKGASRRLIATSNSTRLLSDRIAKMFEYKLKIGLPSFEDRLEILERLAAGSRPEHELSRIALATGGCNVEDLKHIVGLALEGANMEDVLKDFRCYSQRVVENL